MKGPGTVILIRRSVIARRNSTSPTSTGRARRIGADDSRHGVLVTRAIERDAGIVEIDAVEGRRESIGVALPPHLAVGDQVDASPLHVLDGESGRVVLGLVEERLRDAPELARPHPRRQPRSEPFPVDQPVRLGVAPDDGGDEQGAHPVYSWVTAG